MKVSCFDKKILSIDSNWSQYYIVHYIKWTWHNKIIISSEYERRHTDQTKNIDAGVTK